MINPFEWDENKRLSNLEKHKIDFYDAILIFEYPHLNVPSDYKAEERWITIGELDGRLIMVVWTYRGWIKRIISARKLRTNDKRKYYDHYITRSPQHKG